MAGFNLTAQLQLQAPTNTNQVVSDIEKQLSGISVNVQVKGDPRNLAQINKQMQNVSRSASASSKSVSNLNRNLSEAARRFSVITVATGTMLALARSIKNAVGEAIAFERELVKISQVTGKTVSQLGGLTDEITRLSTSLGASSSDLLSVSRTLAQAGFEAGKTKQALDILAKTSLGATFDSIQDTTEGAIAVLRQFRKEARQAGGDIKFLEQTMDAINSVSKSFAVESGDLITVIRRVGGVFESAGGSVNELIALFTSVRATTRESAETIATGLRTIFTRIQRTDTVDQLAALGIQLRDAQGQFVGAYEGVRRLSQGLSSLDPRDFRFSEIVESLGGFRQVGKVIPLIRQFTVAQDALNVAQSASGSVARDAATAQQSLQVQAAKVTEDFRALMRTLADSSTFRSIAKGALEMASAFIRIAEALEPLLPLITSLIGLKIGKALAPGIGALTGVTRKSEGGRIHKFASGGFVPGTGNRDTVPAMLQPGEFVIKKSSAEKLGAGTLEAMNGNRYATGGLVVNRTDDSQFAGLFAKPKGPDSSGKLISLPPKQGREGSDVLATIGAPKSFFIGGTDEQAFNEKAQNMLETGINQLVSEIAPASGNKASGTILSDIGSADIAGKIFEGVTRTIIGDFRAGGGSQQGFDVPRGAGKNVLGELGNLFNSGNPMSDIDYDNKLTESLSNRQSLLKKAVNDNLMSNPINISTFSGAARRLGTNDLIKQTATVANKDSARLRVEELNAAREKVRGMGLDEETETVVVKRLNSDVKRLGKYINSKTVATRKQKKNAGGKIDSVPALLTPGEFVVKKSAAESIGYGNLNQMNQTGVQRFASGGVVQRFANGGPVSGINPIGENIQHAMSELDPKNAAMLNAAMRSNTSEFNALAAELKGVDPDKAEAALKAFARGAMKGEEDLVTLGTNAAGVVSTVDRLKSTVNKTASQIEEDQNRLSDISGAARTTKEERQAAKEPGSDIQSRLGGAPGDAARGRVQAKAFMGIALEGSSDDVSGDLKKNMDRYNNLIAAGADHQDALNQVMADLDKTEKSRLQKLKESKVGKAAGAVKGVAAKGLGNVGRAAEGAKGAAEAAEKFSFFGAAALSTAVQLSSMSDATKQAATETIAFGAGMAAAGSTAIDMLSGLANIGKTAAAANLLETGASGAATGADTVETGASGAAAAADTVEAGASMAAAGPLLLLVGVVAAVVLTLKYFASKAKAEADEIAKARKGQLDDLASGTGGAGTASSASEGVGEELGLRDSADKFNMAAYSAVGGAVATAGAFALAGASIGSAVPVIGTLVGALVGAGIGYAMLAGANAEEMNARKAQIISIHGSINALQQMGESAKKFDDAMSDLDKIVLPNTTAGKTQRVERELAITADLDAGPTEQEFNKLAQLAAKVGKPLSALSEADFEDMPKELIAFQVASRTTTKSMESLAKKTSAARNTLQKAAELEITGEQSFDELIASGGLLSKAFNASQDAIKEEANGKIAAAKADREAAQIRISSAKQGSDELKAAEKDRESAIKAENDARKRGAAQLKNEEDALRMTTQAAKERHDADMRAAAAAEELRVQLLETTNFMKGLNEIEANQQERATSLSNRSALISGGDMDFTRTGPRGLDGDITMIKDLQAFTNEMMVAIGDLPPALRGEAKKQLGIVTDASRVFSEGRDNVLKNFASAPEGNFGPEQQEKIMEMAGLDPKKLKQQAPDIYGKILKDIEEKGQDGIDAAEFDEIFSPIKEAAAPAQEALQKMNELRNNEIANLSSYLDNVKAKRDAELALLQNVLKANDTARDLVAQARGTKVSARDKEISRRTSAQADLAGTGIRAGDAAGAARTLRSANLQRQAIQKEIQNRKASGASILRLVEKDKRLQETAAKASKELERLADQSDRASDMISQIEEERGKRDVLTGLVTDFVVGGRDEREGMVQAMAGIQNAVATGTLQNQTPEQRSATVGMLDRLENIILPGMGGLTGKQVKQELVFRDAIRMGLDPEIAKELATATSKEEQLIKAVEQLTEQMKFAARMQAAAALASGGLVQYRAGGGSIFQPKGTDTVPAMLTPGEFVIRKSAVDRIGAGNLAALNKGGSVQYRQAGGGINALNAAGGGNVNFPSGDAIRSLFGDAVRSNPGKFIKMLKESGIRKDKFDKINQKIQFLARNNRLNANEFVFADGLANAYDAFIGSSSIFSRADATNVTLKRMPAGNLSGESLNVGAAESLLPSIRDYVTKLGMAANMGAISGMSDKENMLGSRVIQEYTGINLRERAIFLRDIANTRYSNLLNIPTLLERRIKQERGRRDGDTTTELGQNVFEVGGGPGAIGFPVIEGKGAKGASAQLPVFGGEKARGGDRRQQSLEDAIRFLQKQRVLRMATGGGVPGTDTVPAMLTPGEFVMSKAAVAKHGVGYMKSLNRGRIPGFNRGGVVGRGNVQYKHEGGSISGGSAVLSIDPTPLQNVLKTFNTNFSLTLDKISGPLQGMTAALTGIATAFQRMEMTHEFRGDISMSVNISNKDAIIAAVTKGITPSVEQLIINVVDQEFKNRFDNP